MSSPVGGPDHTVESPGSARKARDLVPGSTLGKYKLERVLSAGGMGVVWAAHDPDLERAVALKVLRYENAVPELRTRLLREARAMARLKHPNVLTVYEVDSEGDRDFIAMEYVQGASLEIWLATKPPRQDIWDAIIAAGRGLAAAHSAGLVHRDFKPHNVLRSDAGRVLVTDFGLARGHADPAAVDSTLPVVPSGFEVTVATPTKSSLDAPLTRTGALMGTPAYMAPEQFVGAAPDPRTDQFAYCVSAWQMLSGERPFHGATLDELRRAAGGGVANVKANMSRWIRSVLARGLDADPSRRWPDMNALLAALERAQGRPRRMLQIGVAAVVVVAGPVIALGLAGPSTSRPPASTPSTCVVSPEDEMLRAWSPKLRADALQRFENADGIRYAVAEVDAFAARWIEDYRSGCSDGTRTKKTFAKLGCLLGERDEVAALSELIPVAPPDALGGIEVGGLLPRPEACDGDTPVTPPTLPEDPAKQKTIRALRAKLIAARFVDGPVMLAAMPGLLGEAQAIAWDPIVAEAHRAYGYAAQNTRGEWQLSRDHFREAYRIAQRTHYDHLAAEAAVELLAEEYKAVTDPNDDKQFAILVEQSHAAAHSAGDDPAFIAKTWSFEGHFAQSRGRLDEAIAKYDQARDLELQVHDLPPAVRYGNDAVRALLRRDRPGDVDAAWTRLGDMARSVANARVEAGKLRDLWRLTSFVAHMRGDLVAAHAAADRVGSPTPPADAVAVTGRVVNSDGTGGAGARVVAWCGVLDGDATRIDTHGRFEGDVVTTAADGSFTVRASRACGVVAELGDRRSQPTLIGEGSPTLKLEPTRTISGRVVAGDEVLTGIVIRAHYKLAPETAWDLVEPVDSRSHQYRLAGLPPGAATLRLDSPLDWYEAIRRFELGPVRDGAVVRWPSGPTIDAIVRGDFERETMIWRLRGRHAPKTRAELDDLARASTEAIGHPAWIVGFGDQMIDVMKDYARGDRHAVLRDNAPGEVTVCAAGAAPTSPATCRTIAVPAITLASGDGRTLAPTILVVIKR